MPIAERTLARPAQFEPREAACNHFPGGVAGLPQGGRQQLFLPSRGLRDAPRGSHRGDGGAVPFSRYRLRRRKRLCPRPRGNTGLPLPRHRPVGAGAGPCTGIAAAPSIARSSSSGATSLQLSATAGSASTSPGSASRSTISARRRSSALMRDVRLIVGECGKFLVYENAGPDGDTRDAWMKRWDRQRPAWRGFTAREWDTMTAHTPRQRLPGD